MNHNSDLHSVSWDMKERERDLQWTRHSFLCIRLSFLSCECRVLIIPATVRSFSINFLLLVTGETALPRFCRSFENIKLIAAEVTLTGQTASSTQWKTHPTYLISGSDHMCQLHIWIFSLISSELVFWWRWDVVMMEDISASSDIEMFKHTLTLNFIFSNSSFCVSPKCGIEAGLEWCEGKDIFLCLFGCVYLFAFCKQLSGCKWIHE